MSQDQPVPPTEKRHPREGRRQGDAHRVRWKGRWLILGVVIGLSIGLVGALLLTQTNWGRGQVLGFTVKKLGGELNGILRIDGVDGNLFTGAKLYGVSLTDYDTIPLATADSAYIRYRVTTLAILGGDMVISQLVVWNADLNLFKMPGDTLWNYEKILEDTTESMNTAPSATLIENLRMHDSHISIRSPLSADKRLSPDRQQLAIEEILEDTARWVIEKVPGGYLRQMAIDVDSARVEQLYIGPEQRGGIYLEIKEAVADVRLWRDPPLEIRGLLASLHLLKGIVNYDADLVEMPNTRGESVGRIDLNGDRPMYDVVLTTPEFALADLRWLYPWLPEDPAAGHGSGQVFVEDRPEETLVLMRNLVLEMPGTRLAGKFGLLTGDVLKFVDVDLEASPLDIDAVERLLPEDIPIEGLTIGGAVLKGTS